MRSAFSKEFVMRFASALALALFGLTGCVVATPGPTRVVERDRPVVVEQQRPVAVERPQVVDRTTVVERNTVVERQ
jgi:hypothetical protein